MNYIFKGKRVNEQHKYITSSGFCNYCKDDAEGVIISINTDVKWETIGSSSSIDVKLNEQDIVLINNEETKIERIVFSLDGSATCYTNYIVSVNQDSYSKIEAEENKRRHIEEINKKEEEEKKIKKNLIEMMKEKIKREH